MTKIVEAEAQQGCLRAGTRHEIDSHAAAEAIVKAIRDFGVNASVDGDRIIIKKQINLGMATALPSGNLIVPVIHNADQLSLVGLATRVNDLADRARTGKLKPDDTARGTYTMFNVGTFGNVMGTPSSISRRLASSPWVPFAKSQQSLRRRKVLRLASAT